MSERDVLGLGLALACFAAFGVVMVLDLWLVCRDGRRIAQARAPREERKRCKMIRK